MQAPSASNTVGTALGTLAAGILQGYMTGALWVPPIAAAIGMTPPGLTSLAVLGVGMGVGYLVTHVAEVKNLNDFVSDWWPQIQKAYPDDPSGPVSMSGANTNFNQPVGLPDNVASHSVVPTKPQ